MKMSIICLEIYIFYYFFITYESFGTERMMDALSLKTPLWCSQIRVRLSAPWRNCNKRCNRKRYETLLFCSLQNCSIKVLRRAYLVGGKCTDRYA